MQNKHESSFARRFGKTEEQADQPRPNRAQRRAHAKHQKSKQRRAQKAWDRQQKTERRLQVEAQRTLRRMGAIEEDTFWNGIPTFAVKATAVVQDAEWPQYWARAEGLINERIEVVAVNLDGVAQGGGTMYLDNRDGSGWLKVTEGHGCPPYGHREVRIDESTFEVL